MDDLEFMHHAVNREHVLIGALLALCALLFAVIAALLEKPEEYGHCGLVQIVVQR